MRKRIMRDVALMALTGCMSMAAYAVAPGFYMGFDVGPAYNNGSGRTTTGVPSMAYPNKKNMFTAGVFMGYDFIPYAAAELGANYFSKVNYTLDPNIPTNSSPSTQIGTVNILGVGKYPFGSFSVFAKAGGAIIFQSISKTLIPAGSSSNRHGLRPMYGFGASYDLNQNWVADLSFMQIKSVYLLNNVNMLLLSFSYHFVNRYCGQFLCDD